MLTTLLHGGVGEIVVVCSRYFGGVKLGTGGLSRAYASGVKQVLASLPTVERVDLVLKRVTLGYPDVDGFRRMARDLGVRIEDEDFGADVRFRCAVPSGDTRRFVAAVADLTQGRGTVAEV